MTSLPRNEDLQEYCPICEWDTGSTFGHSSGQNASASLQNHMLTFHGREIPRFLTRGRKGEASHDTRVDVRNAEIRRNAYRLGYATNPVAVLAENATPYGTAIEAQLRHLGRGYR